MVTFYAESEINVLESEARGVMFHQKEYLELSFKLFDYVSFQDTRICRDPKASVVPVLALPLV